MREGIADSSVIISLSAIERLDLLFSLFSSVIVTPAVCREVIEDCDGRPGARELRDAIENGFVAVSAPPVTGLLTLLSKDLGEGEAESIALAVTREDSVLLLDDRDARAKARALDLRLSGVLGVLMSAKKMGMVPSFGDELRRLTEEIPFRVGSELVERLLREVGEEVEDP
jgi:uncharacterized protein